MSRSCTIAFFGFMMALQPAAATTAGMTSDALDAGIVEETRLSGPLALPSREPVTSVHVVAPPPAPAAALSANPLWAIPLSKLSGTRDRPIFSPSRRPPSIVASEPAAPPPAPPRKKEMQPPLALVGTITGDDEGFGIFLDQSTKQALRLKLGDDYQGWRLRMIRGREVTMEKDRKEATLTLPLPGEGANHQVLLTPINADGSSSQAAMRRR